MKILATRVVAAAVLMTLGAAAAPRQLDEDWFENRFLIDIPGIIWNGQPRVHNMSELLSDPITIHVRLEGAGERWSPPDPSHKIIWLPANTPVATSRRQLEPVLREAFQSKRDVHLIFDTNLDAWEHLGPAAGDRTEDRWAAAHADVALALKPAGYESIYAAHSRGTVALNSLANLDMVDRLVIMSPRGDDALSRLGALADHQKVDIVMGVWDLPAFRWGDIPGLSDRTNVKRLARDNHNIRIIELQDFGLPTAVHGQLQNPQHRGFYNVTQGSQTTREYGTLQGILDQRAAGSVKNRANQPPVIRNWWVDQRDMHSPALQVSAARALTNMARDSHSVVVVGQGPAADRMVQDMGRRLGADNVHRVASSESVFEIQAQARSFGADLILGVRDATHNVRHPQQRILATRQAAETLASGVNVLASAFETWELHGRAGGFASDSFKWSGRAYSVAKGLEADIQTHRAGDFVLVQSATLEAVGRIGVDMGLKRLLSNEAVRRNLHKDAFATFGAGELIHATARHIRDGRADIATVEHYLDALVAATWASAGYMTARSRGLGHQSALKVASSAQDAGLFLADYGRKSTQGLADRWEAWRRSGQARALSQQDSANWDRAVTNLERQGHRALASDLQFLRISGGSQDDLNWALGRINTQLSQSRAGSAPSHLTTSETPGQLTRRERSDHATATRLSQDKHRTVVFGYGPAAQHTYDSLAASQGRNNVRWEHSLPSVPERMRIAREFGADSIRAVQHDRYRTSSWNYSRERVQVRGGYRTVTPLPIQEAYRSQQPTSPRVAAGGPTSRWDAGGNVSSYSRSVPTFPNTHAPRVGGVMLRDAASVDGLGVGEFSLVFTDSDGEVDITQLRMFTTALWAVYFSDEGPGISIDPIGEGIDQHLVRYIGHVLNSDLGRVMRETDYAMKEWATGAARPDIPGFENPDDIAGRYGRLTVGAASRFWFVPENLSFSKTDGLLLFSAGRMTLKTEYLFSGQGRKADRANEEFARAFTNSYAAVAARYPVFEELFEYAKLVSLAKYLKDEEVPLLWFLLTNRDMILTEDSPGTVDAFVTKSKHFEGVTIEGGVDLAIRTSASSYKIDAAAAKALRAAAARSTAAGNASTTSLVSQESVSFQVADVDYTMTSAAELTLGRHTTGSGAFQTDLAVRRGGEPSVELVRYHDPSRPGQFGQDWHLMVPFEIAPASEDRVQIQHLTFPRLMCVTNLLTHSEEILEYDADRYSMEGWVPPEDSTSITLGLFLMTDGSFRMADRLGSEFQFDPAGRLTGMYLTEEFGVDYEYQELTASSDQFEQAPYRLLPVGEERTEVNGLLLPALVRIVSAAGESEFFHYDTDPDRTHHSYISENSSVGAKRDLAYMADGSFTLNAERGVQVHFTPSGAFDSQTVSSVTSMTQDDSELTFAYAFDGQRFRIESVGVENEHASVPGERIHYEYDSNGELCAVSSPTRGSIRIETPADDA